MPTGYSLIAYFPLSLKIHNNYDSVPTQLIVLFGPNLRELLSSGLSAKPQSAGRGGFAEFELSCQNRNTMFGLTLRACRSFDYLQETFPETLSGTGNFPEAIGVILKEARAFSWFPSWSPSSYYCT